MYWRMYVDVFHGRMNFGWKSLSFQEIEKWPEAKTAFDLVMQTFKRAEEIYRDEVEMRREMNEAAAAAMSMAQPGMGMDVYGYGMPLMFPP